MLHHMLLQNVHYENLMHMGNHVALINKQKLNPHGLHFYVKDPEVILQYITCLRIKFGKAYQNELIDQAIYHFRTRIKQRNIPGISKLKQRILIDNKWVDTYEVEITYIAMIAHFVIPKK
jgi:hypothetical protein